MASKCIVTATSSCVVYVERVSANVSRVWGEKLWYWGRVVRDVYLKVSVVEQKKSEDSKQTMGIERWKPTSFSLLGDDLGTSNATEVMSYRQIKMSM